MKYKSLFLYAVIGGIIGFIIHLKWHIDSKIELFSFAPHIISGIFYTAIGIFIGALIWYIQNKYLKKL